MNATNPGTVFGGTWVQIKDQFLPRRRDEVRRRFHRRICGRHHPGTHARHHGVVRERGSAHPHHERHGGIRRSAHPHRERHGGKRRCAHAHHKRHGGICWSTHPRHGQPLQQRLRFGQRLHHAGKPQAHHEEHHLSRSAHAYDERDCGICRSAYAHRVRDCGICRCPHPHHERDCGICRCPHPHRDGDGGQDRRGGFWKEPAAIPCRLRLEAHGVGKKTYPSEAGISSEVPFSYPFPRNGG